MNVFRLVCWFGLALCAGRCVSQTTSVSVFRDGAKVPWQVGEPLMGIDPSKLPASEHAWIAVKDPSIVRHDGRWHLFCTLRKNKSGEGRIRIGYLSFADWDQASESHWTVLDLTMGYHGAPQVFFFRPHQKWYLIYQAEDSERGLRYGPCFSTCDDLNEPQTWTKPEPLYVVKEGQKAGLDFWVICDDQKAHLFFTSLNGKMWRSETSLTQFPSQGWTDPVVALKADIFEASHTYAIRGADQFLTLVEAQGDQRRHFKAFIADRLDGPWRRLSNEHSSRFVSPESVINQSQSWATSYSHGEFLRHGKDERLEINNQKVQILFQGANDAQYRNRSYGQIPWRLGLLSHVSKESLAETGQESEDRE